MTHPLPPLTWQCIRCQRTFTPTPTDPDQTAYAVETKNGKRVGEICRPCYERDDIVARNPEDFEPYPQPHAPDGKLCWCGNYHPTDEDIGIYE